MTSYLYYPGCSMDGTGRAYASSLAAVAEELDIDLREIDDWNCCGAFEYFALSQTRAHALVARNLALAEDQARRAPVSHARPTLLAACSACYLNLAKTDFQLRDDIRLGARINTALEAGGLHYTPGAVEVRHLFEVLVKDVGMDEIARHVTHPLEGLRVAPYLGCLVTRPDLDRRWAAHDQPREFDRLMAALGAEVVDFPLRTACCGGHMSQISPETGFELTRRLLDAATRLDADLLATVCPMCQMNVDVYQAELNRAFGTDYRMPILFFTQLMGLAFGAAPDRLGIGRELVSARQALDRIGVSLPAAGEVPDATASGPADGHGTDGHGPVGPGGGTPRTPRPRRPQGLPMPRMPEAAATVTPASAAAGRSPAR